MITKLPININCLVLGDFWFRWLRCSLDTPKCKALEQKMLSILIHIWLILIHQAVYSNI